jgi:hypothetical protein
MPRLAEGYLNLYRKAISDAFRTQEGRELEKLMGVKFNHSPTYEVSNGDLYAQHSVTQLKWPTPENVDGT